jgi:very-short-patch-repair endonuclease
MPKLTTARARSLRRDIPKCERMLWRHLCNRQLADAKFRRQHPIDRYVADFACVEAMLVVEVDGPTHHGRETNDALRTQVLETCGWRVLRFTNEDVREALTWVLEEIAAELAIARCAASQPETVDPLTFPRLRRGPLPLPRER